MDGPGSSGKSTIAKRLAKELNIMYLDTGAMYRCLGLKAFQTDLVLDDLNAVQRLLDTTSVLVQYKDGSQRVVLDGTDVTSQIREHHVSKLASDISAIPIVRVAMATMQREIATSNDCVLDGRDIGTYVLPNANYKFFLTASVEVRANRRYKELIALGQSLPYEKVFDDLKLRDYNDEHRQCAPLKQAADAVVIDTSQLSIDEVVQNITNIIRRK